MRFIENEVYHIYNRGNNSQTIFFNDLNYKHFLTKIQRELKPHCEILAYCLMPNHFHLMILATEASSREIPSYGGKPMQILARKIGLMLSSYSQQVNKKRGTTGSLFQQKNKSKMHLSFWYRSDHAKAWADRVNSILHHQLYALYSSKSIKSKVGYKIRRMGIQFIFWIYTSKCKWAL